MAHKSLTKSKDLFKKETAGDAPTINSIKSNVRVFIRVCTNGLGKRWSKHFTGHRSSSEITIGSWFYVIICCNSYQMFITESLPPIMSMNLSLVFRTLPRPIHIRNRIGSKNIPDCLAI
jgi:hypothetical protein